LVIAPAPPKPAAPATLAAKADPKSAAVHNQKGRELLNSGKYAAAIEELSAAIASDPSMALAYNARGFAYFMARDYSHALADLDRAIELKPGYENAIHNRDLARKAAPAVR